MLLDVPYKSGDTVSLKLTSGEEMIARLEEEGGQEITVTKPMMIVAAEQGIGLAPFMFSVATDSKFKVKTANVMCITKTETGFAKQYLEQTTSLKL